MLVIHGGTYHWKPKRIAFRADFCRSCQAPRLSVLISTVDVVHVFWIPLLPLGRWSRWFCTTCGHRPHQSTHTRRGFKVAAATVLVLISVVFWVVPPEDDPWMMWMLRVALPVVTVLTIRWAWRAPPEPDFEAQLAQVAEFHGWSCPLCGGELLNYPKLQCTQCHADHRPLPRRRLSAAGT